MFNLYFEKGNIPEPTWVAYVESRYGFVFRKIFLQDKFFLERTDAQRIGDIIHELSHIYSNGYLGNIKNPFLGLKDHVYWSIDNNRYELDDNEVLLTQQQKLENASTFEHFIAALIKIPLQP